MTREELMEDIQIGQIIKIYTMVGDVFFGRVDSFGPSGLKILQLGNNAPKRIMYEKISEYDIDVDEKDCVIDQAAMHRTEGSKERAFDRSAIFRATRKEISSDMIMEAFEKQVDKKAKSSCSSVQNILAYAKKIGEYQQDSDRVKRAIAELKILSKSSSIFDLYIAAILCDFREFASSAEYCFACQNYELAFYLYEKAGHQEMMFRSAALSVRHTKDAYIMEWLCAYAVKTNNAHMIQMIVSDNETYANKAMVYWFADSSFVEGLESIEQAYADAPMQKMKQALHEIGEEGKKALSFVYENQGTKAEPASGKQNEVKTGTITFYNKNGRNGYIKEDGAGSIYFYIKQVKDYDLQKILATSHHIRQRVTYTCGMNHTGKIAADRIEMIAKKPKEAEVAASKHKGYILEYDKFSEYGKISFEGNLYNFQFNAIKDPLLRADIEYSYEELELDVEFTLKKRMNKTRKTEETVACDIVGVKEYSDEEISEWIRYGILSQQDVDAWLKQDDSAEEVAWSVIDYEPLKPITAQTKRNVENQVKHTHVVPFDDQEETICNEMIKDMENPFLSMEKIAAGGNYREQARKYSIGIKIDNDESTRALLERAESLFIKAIQAGEQLRSTVPDLVNVYIRLGGYQNDYIIKGLQLLSVYGHLLPSESLMHLRVQLIDKGNDKIYLEKILENSIKKCTKKNTKYHFMSKLAGLYLETGKYEKASDLFKQCAAFLEKNKAAFIHYEKMKQWPIRSIIIADYYAGDKDGAIQKAKEFLLINPEDSTIKSIAEGTIDETKKEKILDDIIDAIPYDNYENMNETFLVSELSSPYSSYMLERCEYSQIRDRRYDEETGRYVWTPETEEKANGVYDSLAQFSSIFGKDGKLRPGTYEEVADKRLNMSKIAEYCLKNSTELNLTSKRITLWKGRFIWATAQYMWLHHNIYSLKQNVSLDTSSYFLLECISMFFKDENYRLRYEFYDAVNRFCIIQSHLPHANFTQIEIKKAESLNKKNVGQKQVDEEIAQLESVVYSTFARIFEADARSAMKILGAILESCNKEAISYFAHLFSDLEDQLKMALSKHAEDDDAYACSLEEMLDDYARQLHKNYDKFLNDLDEISEALMRSDLIGLNLVVGRMENTLKQDEAMPINNADIERCKKLLEQIQAFIHLKNTATTNYEISQERANSVRNEAAYLRQTYLENPTRVSHDRLSELMQIICETTLQISDDITVQSLPEITVENEYEEEGYFPQNERINLMLLISNGKSGKQCTTASNIQLDIDYDDALKKYTHIEQTHFHLLDSLSGGEQNSQQVTLHLTSDGVVPDTVFAMKAKVSYQTIKGTEEHVDIVLNVHIKSEDAFVEIRNPYDISPIKPGKETEHLFKGRAADISNISNKLLSGGQGKTVLIYGQYRSGKTSLSNFLVREIESRDPSIITVDGLTVTEGQNAWDIINKITEAICDQLDALGQLPENLEVYLDPQATSDNYERCFTRFAKELYEVAEKQNLHILVVIDEFGRFFKNDLSDNFMQLWKSVMELGVFNAILIGHDVVTQMMRRDTNSFGIINTYQINYIDWDATQQVVTEPTRMKDQRTRFTDNAIQYIWEQSAGNVFYIQLICQATIRFMNKRHINIVNEVYIKQAIEEWLDNDADEAAYLNYGHPLFLSGEIGEGAANQDETIIVLDAISRGQNDTSEEEIIRLAMENYGQAEQVTKTILNSLRARRVVDQHKDSGKFSIRCRFYPDFLNDHIIQSIH